MESLAFSLNESSEEPLQTGTGRLPEEKRAHQNRERNQMPPKPAEDAEGDYKRHRYVNRQEPLP